jgi:hypothetical protein
MVIRKKAVEKPWSMPQHLDEKIPYERYQTHTGCHTFGCL